ncbi:DUF551 domain-containing protein [Caulobacter sp. UC70_42]|uniref:DUF551 domain-containing protein n=1 Tax=Caulobacter sp. UC70_42 TaxID=3374551 RepID=UPI003757CC05
MTHWLPIESAPRDGSLVLLWSPLGGSAIAPSLPSAELSQAARVALYEATGEWPNVGWNPTHWMPLPDPPVKG